MHKIFITSGNDLRFYFECYFFSAFNFNFFLPCAIFCSNQRRCGLQSEAQPHLLHQIFQKLKLPEAIVHCTCCKIFFLNPFCIR